MCPAPQPQTGAHQDPPEDRETAESRVLSKATARAAEHLGISNVKLAVILGLSEASVSRLKKGTYRLRRGDKAFELAQLFVRLFRGLDSLTGGDDAAARSWLNGPNLALGGVRPIEHIRSITGLVETIAYVDARRALI